jgi:Histidine kinase-, DNA gyrase B-, and HSP90-like ATPase
MSNKIKVHEKALAHLSRGLYRSPASALRELVSNAWDGNATVVRANTNYPNFFQISVEDNGDGFSREIFETLMEGGIGNSPKRPLSQPLINDRPLIGRIGIGMLGIAQVCGTFTITSKPRHGEGFRAKINLYDLLKPGLDRNDPHLVEDKIVDIGEYEFEKDYDLTRRPVGTLILTNVVHPTFTRAFQESLKFDKFKEPSRDWKKALLVLSKVHSLQEMGDYWRLLWELAASCPLPYISKNALPDALIHEDQERLDSYNFKVLVDGIQIFKPVYLHGNPNGYTWQKIQPVTQTVYGKNLTFHGYVAVQEAAQLHPDELRGVLVRVKNVGIGYYDPSMLDYRFNEGPRAKWLTGEIFVDEGLEDALNIDRDSFNKFHPEYRTIQTFVHDILRRHLFPDVYKQIEVRSQAKAKERESKRRDNLRNVINQAVPAPVTLRYKREQIESKTVPQAELTETKQHIEIALPDPSVLRTKKSNRELASAILSIFEIALREKTDDKRRQKFTSLLLDLLKGW